MTTPDATTSSANPKKSTGIVNIDVHETSSAEHVNEKCNAEKCSNADCGHVQWETGFWKRFPWIGAAAIMIMLLCIAMDGVILATSAGKYREEWPSFQNWSFVSDKWKRKAQIEPHVLLAIVNTVTNVALGIAIGHGVAIAWWRRVLRGSTIEDLHKSWGFSSSVLELLTAGKMFNYIALAALMAKIALIDNVLLQQAVSTSPGWYTQKNMELRMPVAKVLPDDYIGFVSSDESTAIVSSAFGSDLFDYTVDSVTIYPESIYGDYRTGCIGFCNAAVQGFGFEWECSSIADSETYQITPELAKGNSQQAMADAFFAANATNEREQELLNNRTYNSALQRNPLLSISAVFIPAGSSPSEYFLELPSSSNVTLDYGTIGLQAKWAQYNNEDENRPELCSAVTRHQFCTLKPATVNYTLQITNVIKDVDEEQVTPEARNGAILGLDPSFVSAYCIDGDYASCNIRDGQLDGYQVVAPVYRPYKPEAYDSNLKTIAKWLQASFSSYVQLEWVNRTSFQGYAPNVNAGGSSFFASSWLKFDPSPSCALQGTSPLYRIGQDLNNLMVRSSMRAATKTDASLVRTIVPESVQTQTIEQQIASVYFTTHWAFGASAMGIIFFCVLCVLPSYWGFWQLGRKVTLGPIEVAGAFQAPVLDHPSVAAHGEVDDMVKQIGQRRVRYGQVEGQPRLAVAPPAEVVRPGASVPAQ